MSLRNRTAYPALLLLLLSFAVGTVSGRDKYDPSTLVFPSFLHTMGIRKATKTHLKIYTRNRVKVNNPQGMDVVRLQSWDDPNSSKDDDEVTGYGINSGENAIVYNKSMTSLGFYGLREKGVAALNSPTGVCALEDGNVFVADKGNHRIVHLFNPKANLRFRNALGGRGSAPGEFESPSDVAVDILGHLYVCDTGNNRVQVLSRDGIPIKQIGTGGQVTAPTGIAVTTSREKWSYYKDSFIAVIDMSGTRLQKFDLDGALLATRTLDEIGATGGMMMYAAIDYYSNIWVTDIRNHCVHKFDNMLQYLTSFGRRGNGHKEFMEPRGIAIYKRFGQVFIAEKESAQYYWIGTDIFDFAAIRNTEAGLPVIELTFFLTEPSFVTLDVEENNSHKTLFERQRRFSGTNAIYLDGQGRLLKKALISNESLRTNSGFRIVPVQQGKYRFKLKAEPTYSSYKYFSKEVETDIIIH